MSQMLRCLPLLALGASVAGCHLEAAPRGNLEVRLLGPAHPRPRCAKGQAELGPVNALGEPVVGARVEVRPANLTATSDAQGRVRFEGLAADTYEIKVRATGFLPADGTGEVVSAGDVVLQVGLDPCVSAGSGKLRVGFDAPVELSARIVCGAEWQNAAFSWTLLEGPEVSGSVNSWEGPVLRFRTRTLEEVRGPLPDQGGILSFSPDQAGEYVFQVTARSSGGQLAKDLVMVSSTNVSGGMNSVPTHDVQYFLAPNKKGPWSWKLLDKPKGWLVTLQGADTRTPWVQAIPPPTELPRQSEVWLMDMTSGTQFLLDLTTWNAVPRDCGTRDCHPTLQQSWERTRHGMTWRKLVDGETLSERGPAAESCGGCHALGWDPSVPNGGYDDAVADPALRFPQPQRAGNYAALPEPLQNTSNVYCLACHGPSRVDPPVGEQFGRFSVGVCARCHDRRPVQDLVAQWRTSRMSRTVKGLLNGVEQRRECARCHTAEGFYYQNFALGRPPASDVVQLRCCPSVEPITCQACHSPMFARNPAQVFRYGVVRTGSGLELKDIGAGALCVTCHSTDHDVRATTGALEARLAPHSPQAELSYGRAGYAMPLPAGAPELPALEGVACSRTAGQGCVTCHMDKGPGVGQPGHRQVGDHTFRIISSEGVANTRPCQACHTGRGLDPLAGGDWDGDGVVRGVRDEVRGLMALLRDRLAAQLETRGYRGCDAGRTAGTWFKAGDRSRLVITDREGFDLGDCDRNGVVEREERAFLVPDTALYQAAYNLRLLELDGSQGLHNLPYAVKLLQRTLLSLTGGGNLPDWELRR